MYPLVMMGTALDRYLPGCYSMLVNESMYIYQDNVNPENYLKYIL